MWRAAAVREPERGRVLGELCEPRVREHDAVRVLALRAPQAERRARPLHLLLLHSSRYHGPAQSRHRYVLLSDFLLDALLTAGRAQGNGYHYYSPPRRADPIPPPVSPPIRRRSASSAPASSPPTFIRAILLCPIISSLWTVPAPTRRRQTCVCCPAAAQTDPRPL